MSLDNLLPDLGSAPSCSSYTSGLEVDPVGSAFHAQLVVLIETPLPWPKPVFEHRLLAGVNQLMRSASIPTRILACEPFRSADDSGVGLVTFRFDGASYQRSTRVVAAEDVLEAVAAECAGETAASGDTNDRRSLLLCTQGSHDVCCGELGVALADDSAARHPDVDVFRVSHTGGHRFAPTALSMPDGRMWAFLSADDVDIILDRRGKPSIVAAKCRGWIGAKQGAAQTGERAAFANAEWRWDATPRSAVATVSLDLAEGAPQQWDVVVDADGQTQTLTVAIGREVPSISCMQPGGLPAKPGREYTVLEDH